MEKIKQEMEAKMKNQIINKEIELQINLDIKNNNIGNENDKTESIKEDENAQNKSGEKKYLNKYFRHRESPVPILFQEDITFLQAFYNIVGRFTENYNNFIFIMQEK